jgi:hypothetical protein
LYPTLHQGRIFATDGKTIFYSKSLDEVTTSTGLITSKWEECWPGDYQLPIALNNEIILGLKSDGSNLHVGTDKSIYTVSGDGPTNFSVPAVAFAQTGILSNDSWNVVYAEGQPAGFVWLTQDRKVMFSDFSTYQDIGTTIFPVLQTMDPAKLLSTKCVALTYGPYNLVILQIWLTSSSSPDLYLWDTRLKKWYHWLFPTVFSNPVSGNALVGGAFIYQFPAFSASGQVPGSAYVFVPRFLTTSGSTLQNFRFQPDLSLDYGAQVIPWTVQTSWQDMGDSQAIKVVDEIEFTSSASNPGATDVTVSLYGASSETDFEQFAAGILAPLKTGLGVIGPIASLRSSKLYCAGVPTAAKYYSVAFSGDTQFWNTHVLTSFSVETYPMARI